ncbi:hypothetical protein WJX74_000412 [Apatococcus lobatus]|uniref:Uncharacterized protein n=1 Tax=Apatococcus lobatus TaxID=904363 RepID=A0AAW1QHE9_9CHLO
MMALKTPGSVEVAAVQATIHDMAIGCGAEVAAEVDRNGLQQLLEPKLHVGLTSSSGRLKGVADAYSTKRHGQSRFPNQLHGCLTFGIPHPGWLVLHPLPGGNGAESSAAHSLFLATAAQVLSVLQDHLPKPDADIAQGEMTKETAAEVSIRLPDALVVHMFNGFLQPGDQMVAGKLHDGGVCSFVWHEIGAPKAAIDHARTAAVQGEQHDCLRPS